MKKITKYHFMFFLNWVFIFFNEQIASSSFIYCKKNFNEIFLSDFYNNNYSFKILLCRFVQIQNILEKKYSINNASRYYLPRDDGIK